MKFCKNNEYCELILSVEDSNRLKYRHGNKSVK